MVECQEDELQDESAKRQTVRKQVRACTTPLSAESHLLARTAKSDADRTSMFTLMQRASAASAQRTAAAGVDAQLCITSLLRGDCRFCLRVGSFCDARSEQFLRCCHWSG